MLESLTARLHLALVRHRGLVLAATAALALLGLALSSGIRLDQDLRMVLPQGDAEVAAFYDSVSKFRPMDRLYVDVSTNRPDPAALGGAADALAERLRSIQGLRDVMATVDLEGTARTFERLAGAVPNLFAAEDVTALERRLEPERIRDRLAWFKRHLAGTPGAFLKEAVRRDPVGMTDLLRDRLVPLQAGFGGARVEDGHITSGDGRHVLIVAEAAFPPSDVERSAALVDAVARAARAVELERKDAGLSIAFSGTHRASLDNRVIVQEDAAGTSSLATGILLALVLIVYRPWWLGFYSLLPILFGTAVAGATVALLHDRVSAIAVGCGAAFIGIADDFGIHVLFHLGQEKPGDHEGAARRLGFLAAPMAVGALTTAGALILLLLSPIPGYRQLGLFAAVGLLGAAAFALGILPLLIPASRRGESPAARALIRGFERLAAWRRRRAGAFMAAALLLTAAAAVGLGRVTFDGNPEALNGVSPETREADRRLRSAWGDALALTLVVTEAPTSDEALRKDGLVACALRGLQEKGLVTTFSAVSDLCPSRAAQAENVRRWRAFWTPARKALARERLAAAAAGLGYRPAAFEPWLESLDREPVPLALADFADTPVQRALEARVAATPAGAAVSAVVKLRNRDDVARLRDAVRTAAPDAIVIDAKAVATRVAGLARDGLTRYGVLAMAVVAVVLMLIFGSVTLAVVAILPVAVGLAWTFGILGLLGIPINVVSCAFVVFLVGVGIEYSEFLVAERLAAFQGGPGRTGATTGAVALCALTTLTGFASLAFARHPALFSVGVTTALGMACTILAALALAPLGADLVLRRDRAGVAPRLAGMAGALRAGLYLAVAQALLVLAARPVIALRFPRSPARRRAALRRLARAAARGLLALFPRVRRSWEGIAPETFQPPAVIVSNHQSNLDPLLIMSLPHDIRLTIKDRWFDSPLIGFSVRHLGYIRVDARSPAATLEACRRALAEGACVHFFPEGTRSPDGDFIQFHRGAFRLAAELQCDVLPIVISGSGESLRPGAWWGEGADVRVRALPRIATASLDGAGSAGALMNRAKAILSAAYQEQLDRSRTPAALRKTVARLYRYQGPIVERYVYWKLRTDPLFAAIDGVVPRHGRILDLGCGYGLVAHWLLLHGDGREIRGIDDDERKIGVARSTVGERRRIAFERHDLLEWEPSPAGADAALLLDVLHYWRPERQADLLARARRAIRPGGRLVLRDMVREDSSRFRRTLAAERFAIRIGFNRTSDGLHPLSIEALHEALRRAGFARVIEVVGAGTGTDRMWVAECE